jgi:hypothetical protein
MKLKNAPGRKNQRRIEAAERVRDSNSESLGVIMALKDTLKKIVDPVTARNTRTKKNRA